MARPLFLNGHFLIESIKICNLCLHKGAWVEEVGWKEGSVSWFRWVWCWKLGKWDENSWSNEAEDELVSWSWRSGRGHEIRKLAISRPLKPGVGGTSRHVGTSTWVSLACTLRSRTMNTSFEHFGFKVRAHNSKGNEQRVKKKQHIWQLGGEGSLQLLRQRLKSRPQAGKCPLQLRKAPVLDSQCMDKNLFLCLSHDCGAQKHFPICSQHLWSSASLISYLLLEDFSSCSYGQLFVPNKLPFLIDFGHWGLGRTCIGECVFLRHTVTVKEHLRYCEETHEGNYS